MRPANGTRRRQRAREFHGEFSGGGAVSQQINLYQPIFRKEEKKFSTVAMFQAVGLVAIGVVLLYGFTWWQSEALKSELKRVEQSYATASKRLADASQKFGSRTGT